MGNKTTRDFFWVHFSSVSSGEKPQPHLLMTALEEVTFGSYIFLLTPPPPPLTAGVPLPSLLACVHSSAPNISFSFPTRMPATHATLIDGELRLFSLINYAEMFN